jgi:hypothetical protein
MDAVQMEHQWLQDRILKAVRNQTKPLCAVIPSLVAVWMAFLWLWDLTMLGAHQGLHLFHHQLRVLTQSLDVVQMVKHMLKVMVVKVA